MALIDWKAANGSADDVSHYTVSGKQLAPTNCKSRLCSILCMIFMFYAVEQVGRHEFTAEFYEIQLQGVFRFCALQWWLDNHMQ